MTSQEKIAIVTGANKGIGYGIVKGLCEKFKGKVYLTSRDVNRGKEAVSILKELGFEVCFHQLDIENPSSVEEFKNYIDRNYGGVDILINNAGIAFKRGSKDPFSRQALVTVRTNYFGTLRVAKAFLPLMRNDSQLVHMSSSCGHLSKVPSPKLKERFSSNQLTVEQLNELMEEFVKIAKDGTGVWSWVRTKELGWGTSAYNISKVGVSALARVQQRIVDEQFPEKNISVNTCHPGYVATDMTSWKGSSTIEEGAESALYLALEPHGLKGQYIWEDCTVVDWCASSTPQAF